MKQKDNKPILLIIPDIHGRLFWISATRKYPDLPVIFLGDYLDPYTYYEEIPPSEALAHFKEILLFCAYRHCQFEQGQILTEDLMNLLIVLFVLATAIQVLVKVMNVVITQQ